MDCFYHSAVPSVGRCTACGRAICATCRSEQGDCPGCRLAERIDAAKGPRAEIPGGTRRPQPEPPYEPRRTPRVTVAASTSLATVRPETRALVALGYPFWPLALLALLDPSKNPAVRRHALQSLAFNGGMYGLAWLLGAIASIPLFEFSVWPLLPFVFPVMIVANVVFAFRAWHGEDVHVPYVTEYLDQHQPA